MGLVVDADPARGHLGGVQQLAQGLAYGGLHVRVGPALAGDPLGLGGHGVVPAHIARTEHQVHDALGLAHVGEPAVLRGHHGDDRGALHLRGAVAARPQVNGLAPTVVPELGPFAPLLRHVVVQPEQVALDVLDEGLGLTHRILGAAPGELAHVRGGAERCHVLGQRLGVRQCHVERDVQHRVERVLGRLDGGRQAGGQGLGEDVRITRRGDDVGLVRLGLTLEEPGGLQDLVQVGPHALHALAQPARRHHAAGDPVVVVQILQGLALGAQLLLRGAHTAGGVLPGGDGLGCVAQRHHGALGAALARGHRPWDVVAVKARIQHRLLPGVRIARPDAQRVPAGVVYVLQGHRVRGATHALLRPNPGALVHVGVDAAAQRAVGGQLGQASALGPSCSGAVEAAVEHLAPSRGEVHTLHRELTRAGARGDAGGVLVQHLGAARGARAYTQREAGVELGGGGTQPGGRGGVEVAQQRGVGAVHVGAEAPRVAQLGGERVEHLARIVLPGLLVGLLLHHARRLDLELLQQFCVQRIGLGHAQRVFPGAGVLRQYGLEASARQRGGGLADRDNDVGLERGRDLDLLGHAGKRLFELLAAQAFLLERGDQGAGVDEELGRSAAVLGRLLHELGEGGRGALAGGAAPCCSEQLLQLLGGRAGLVDLIALAVQRTGQASCAFAHGGNGTGLDQGGDQGSARGIGAFGPVLGPGLVGVGDRGIDRILHEGSDLLPWHLAGQQACEEVAQPRLAEAVDGELHRQDLGQHLHRRLAGGTHGSRAALRTTPAVAAVGLPIGLRAHCQQTRHRTPCADGEGQCRERLRQRLETTVGGVAQPVVELGALEAGAEVFLRAGAVVALGAGARLGSVRVVEYVAELLLQAQGLGAERGGGAAGQPAQDVAQGGLRLLDRGGEPGVAGELGFSAQLVLAAQLSSCCKTLRAKHLALERNLGRVAGCELLDDRLARVDAHTDVGQHALANRRAQGLLDLGQRAQVIARDQRVVRVGEVVRGGGEAAGVVGQVHRAGLHGPLGFLRVGARGVQGNAQAPGCVAQQRLVVRAGRRPVGQ